MTNQRLAQWVADLMKADEVKPEQVTTELALAYVDEAGRRIAKMQTIYMTRTGAKEAVCNAVFALL